jgi:ribonuclease H / adenosylcobalamin/alpha-ribazole phosphatase
MTTMVLVRHAATAWSGRRYCGRGDPPLSAAGRRSAEALAERLGGTLPTAMRIVTSPSRRAFDTATLLAARAAPAALETDARWLEADMGDVEGCTFDQLGARYSELAARLAAGAVAVDWPGGESAAALHERVRAAWAAVLATQRPTIIVSHAGPIRIALALASGRAPAEVPLPDLAEAITLEIEPAVGGGARDAPMR